MTDSGETSTNLQVEAVRSITRRHFLRRSSLGLGSLALGLLSGGRDSLRASGVDAFRPKPPHFPPKARRVIFLHMAGAPSQLELFDYKPELIKLNGQDLSLIHI